MYGLKKKQTEFFTRDTQTHTMHNLYAATVNTVFSHVTLENQSAVSVEVTWLSDC